METLTRAAGYMWVLLNDRIKSMGQISEAEISMALNTFMYLDYKEAAEGASLREILGELEKLPAYQEGGRYYGEYTILKQASVNEEVGGMVIGNQSVDMGYDSGTAACTFMTPDKHTVYVVFRGTGDGEWPDNGIGLCSAVTTQQGRALDYFEEVVEAMGPGSSQRLVVTGHSKGGNKAQFVTMETEHQEKIAACYSVDGQGFSPEAVAMWQDKYGKEGYEERTRKIKGIHGENDYVSVLGECIIPKGNIRYVRTPVEKSNFAGYHDIKYLFAERKEDPETGRVITVFRGRKNQDAPGRGILGDYAAGLSCLVMALPSRQRDGCAAVVMQVMESLQGSKEGLNGEKLKLSDLSDFTFLGIPVIARSLFWDGEGKDLLGALARQDEFVDKLQRDIQLETELSLLHIWSRKLEEIAKETEEKNMYSKLRLTAETVQEMEKRAREIADAHEKIGLSYGKWQQQSIEMASAAVSASKCL